MKMKDFIDKHFGNLKIKTIHKIAKNTRHSVYSKDREVINWSPSPLQGVHQITYTDRDRDMIFKAFEVEYFEFKRDILNIDGLNTDFNVSTTPAYVLTIVLIHLLIKNDEYKEETITNLFLINSYRVITSAYSNYYSYPVEESIARLVYDRMSKKFLIKKLGSNFALLTYKSKYLFKGTTTYEQIKICDADNLTLATNFCSNTVRQYIHTGFLALLDVLDSNDKTIGTSLLNGDNEVIDISNNTKLYYENMERALFNKDILMDNDVIELLGEVLKVNTKHMPASLTALHQLTISDPEKPLKLINDIISGTLYYLYKNDFYPPYSRDIGMLIKYLKAYWSNSKVKNENVTSAKEIMSGIIIKDLKIHRIQTVNGLTVLTCVYIFLIGILLTKK